jgi:hypothetical protein
MGGWEYGTVCNNIQRELLALGGLGTNKTASLTSSLFFPFCSTFWVPMLTYHRRLEHPRPAVQAKPTEHLHAFLRCLECGYDSRVHQ